jgi:hypothetical protein
MFHMANDSEMFRTREQLEPYGWTLTGNVFVRDGQEMLPLYESKLIHHYDHRLACYRKRPEGSEDTELPRLGPEEKNDPYRTVIPHYWVQDFDTLNEHKSKTKKQAHTLGVTSRLAAINWNRSWLFGWHDTGRSTDERTVICSLLPHVAVSNKLPLALPAKSAGLLESIWSSFVFDYVARQKITGATLNFFLVKQVPTLHPSTVGQAAPWNANSSLSSWIIGRVLELTFTAWDMEGFARDLGDGHPPFRWNEKRRFLMRAELDAAFFHLYGIERDDVDYIMETFPIVKRKDEQRYRSFRTKELILDVYDAMAEARRTGVPYQTILDPPPGRGPRHPASPE